jgi:hypothetical protein
MVGPWKTIWQLNERIGAQTTEIQALTLKLALAEQAQRTAERDLERALAELHLVQQDFRHLVATATRLPSKSQPMDFSRDPFEEDVKIPDTWLTDDSELPDIGALEEIVSGQSEAGNPGRSDARPGAERPA